MRQLLPSLRGVPRAMILAGALFLLCASSARSTFSGNYIYSSGTGASVDMTGATVLLGDNRVNATSSITNIGFNFTYDGTVYTQFSVSSNGLMRLGPTTVTTSSANSLTGQGTAPIIAPFWDALHTGLSGAGGVFYKVTGSSPNRILTVEWKTRLTTNTVAPFAMFQFQVRLYETTNQCEFLYVSMPTLYTTSATIGLAAASTNYVSWTPPTTAAGIPTRSFSVANNNINLLTTAVPLAFIPANTVYTTTRCEANIGIAGNTSQGGTVNMTTNDNLLTGFTVQRGNNVNLQPFTISLGTTLNPACVNRTFTYTITGTNASDYVISPTSGTLADQGTNTPTVTFTPSAVGVRVAILTVRDNNGFVRTYNLRAEGTTRIQYTGFPAQGGTEGMAGGDVLLSNIRTNRFSQASLQPFTVTNTNNNAAAPTTTVSYSLNDPTNQYKLVDPVTGAPTNSFSTVLASSQSSTPTITFAPYKIWFQPATLTVTTEDGVRSFPLNAYAIAVGGSLTADNQPLNANRDLFKKDFVCVGEYLQSIPIRVDNIADGTLRISSVEVYETDSLYGQGTPPYRLLQDAQGAFIPSMDYVITESPALTPRSANAFPSYPLRIEEKASTTIYLSFLPQLPGKRFARMYIRTNAENFTGVDYDGVTREGLIVVHLMGRGLGAMVTDIPNGTGLPKSIAFPRTRVGKTATRTVKLYNPSSCDLRIGRPQFRIIGGDTKEFRIVDAFSSAFLDQNSNTYVIPPGDSTEITISFTPSRSGSRSATILLQTNDSAMIIPGFTERGAYYWTITGSGSVGLDGTHLVFRPALIDGPEDQQPRGSAFIENTAREVIVIDSMRIVGDHAVEFSMDASNPWPPTPFAFSPGEEHRFQILHTPGIASQPGPRAARLLLFTSDGDTVAIELQGEAATRTVAVAPASLFDGVTVLIGKSARQVVSITNTGTMPLRIGTTVISGPNKSDYRLNSLPRLLIAPGQTEFLEVTYRPTARGQSTATLTINSDATNGAQIVVLGGAGKGIRPLSNSEHATSAVTTGTATGTMLRQTAPNPSRDRVEFAYELANAGTVDLRIYDVQGNEVGVVEQGSREEGRHSVSFDVSSFVNGSYYYILRTDQETLTRWMIIAR